MNCCDWCCDPHENNFSRFDDSHITQQPPPSYQQNQEQAHRRRAEQLQIRNNQLEESNKKKDKEIAKLKNDSDELRSRLSAAMSAAMTDSNPNIADLGDMNRPTKLADQYSELYDNQWTEAFEQLKDRGDNEAIRIILVLFVTIYTVCKRLASKDLDEMTAMANRFVANEQSRKEILKRLKDERKKSYKKQVQEITPIVMQTLRNTDGTQQAGSFVKEAINLCWLMAVQDPPLVIDVNMDLHGKPVDTVAYKHYTKSGNVVDYVVWPVMRLYENGNVLSKGVVQPVDQAQAL